eukprot:gnl/Dysnectes_brevis/11929_a25873_147.p1 GENE.gnl/Dysnectes_brevis/11929_a25873_147~~gnl/Dysnectes_brevis/11929_a25873_147.p1  ORF type:complete len:183 (+),score=60.48 gnl/Dysnectes_brevis/11929_a25873_147:2-550(+)
MEVPLPAPCLHRVPQELWVIIEALRARGLNARGLLRFPGVLSERYRIVRELGSSLTVPLSASVYSVGESLLDFLGSMPEPVVPIAFYSKCCSVRSWSEACSLVDYFPPAHRWCFLYLVSFMRECLRFNEHNELSIQAITTVFGHKLLRPPASKKRESPREQQFLSVWLLSPMSHFRDQSLGK